MGLAAQGRLRRPGAGSSRSRSRGGSCGSRGPAAPLLLLLLRRRCSRRGRRRLVVLVLRAQQVVEDVDDGGDVPLRLTVAVLQGGVQSACNE